MTSDPRRDVAVHLFGDARVEVSGSRVNLTPQQLALLTLVYGHQAAGLSRPKAAEYLWRDASPTVRQRLRQVLLEIRTRVGQPVIDTPGDILQPRLSISSDLEVFASALRRGALHEASHLVGQGFAPVATPPTREFEDWQSGRNLTLLRTVTSAALAAWSHARAGGNWSQASDAAEALYALSPEDADATERIIIARGRTGNLRGAEAAYADYLARVAPGCPTPVELDVAIASARSLGRSVPPPRGGEVQAPFIGRDAPLAQVQMKLDSVCEGNFEMLLITGESGIGKTRLLDEVHRDA